MNRGEYPVRGVLSQRAPQSGQRTKLGITLASSSSEYVFIQQIGIKPPTHTRQCVLHWSFHDGICESGLKVDIMKGPSSREHLMQD